MHAFVVYVLFVCSVGSSALTEECSVPDAMVGLSEYISICIFLTSDDLYTHLMFNLESMHLSASP